MHNAFNKPKQNSIDINKKAEKLKKTTELLQKNKGHSDKKSKSLLFNFTILFISVYVFNTTTFKNVWVTCTFSLIESKATNVENLKSLEPICPWVEHKRECTRKDREYRTFNGICNNLKEPLYGLAGTPFQRIIEDTDYNSDPCKWFFKKKKKNLFFLKKKNKFFFNPFQQ